MAMAIGGATLTGKVGDKVHSINGTVRRLRVAKNGKSVKQVGSRSRLALLSTQYRSLTAEEQDAWKQAALNYSRTNRAGIAKTLTGSQLYIEVNGLAYALKEQLGEDLGGSLTPPVPTTATPSQVIGLDAALELSLSGEISADERIVIYASRGQSTGTRRSTGEKLIASLAAADITENAGPPITFTSDIATAYAAVYGVPQAGLTIFVNAYIVNVNEMVKRPAGSALARTV